jgi:photosystem II stability/assembly factor-like uncharacterized protein
MTGKKGSRFLILISALLLFCALLLVFAPAAAAEPEEASSLSGWSVQDSGVTADLNGVSVVDEQTVWAVGQSGNILKTTDGGATWIQQGPEIYANLLAISAVDSENAWAVGSHFSTSGTILRTTDGGSTWVNVAPCYQDVLHFYYDVQVVDANTAWVVGFYTPRLQPWSKFSDVILKTNDGGATWLRPYTGGYTTTPFMLSSISLSSPADGWVAGLAGKIMKSGLGGNIWLPQNSGTTSDLSDICAANPKKSWAVGTGGVIVETANGGWNWHPQDSGTTSSLNGVHAVDEGTAWAVGEDGTVLKTVDGGDDWHPQESGVSGIALNDIDALDVTTAWAVGSGGTVLNATCGGDERPDILSISPSTGLEGTEVTICGCDFDGGIHIPEAAPVSFGDIEAPPPTYWADDKIQVDVPAGVDDLVKVTVNTPDGTSNGVNFSNLTVSSIAPDEGMQFTNILYITDLAGTGFKDGASVSLKMDGKVINASGVVVLSDTQIQCTLNLSFAQPGVYDVVVRNADGMEARLEAGFTVNSACGEGGGMAVMMLGITLGLLSMAGGFRLRRSKTGE